jgi:hypothetical protein
MEKVWVCFSVSRTLTHNDDKAILKELSLIFGDDLLGHKVVCNDQMVSSGEYYLFVHCVDYWTHTEAVNKCHFITGVIPTRDEPHHFSSKEIAEFLESAGHKVQDDDNLVNGDVVLIKKGYLKGLYGIVIKELARKKYKVFFSFYVKQFFEDFRVTDLEFIGKVSGHEFPSDCVGKPVIIGAQVVYPKLHRTECRKYKPKQD